jgi:hypothetical protein
MREALLHIAGRLESLQADQLPHIIRFARDMAEGGKRPGFDSFIAEKLDAALG